MIDSVYMPNLPPVGAQANASGAPGSAGGTDDRFREILQGKTDRPDRSARPERRKSESVSDESDRDVEEVQPENRRTDQAESTEDAPAENLENDADAPVGEGEQDPKEEIEGVAWAAAGINAAPETPAAGVTANSGAAGQPAATGQNVTALQGGAATGEAAAAVQGETAQTAAATAPETTPSQQKAAAMPVIDTPEGAPAAQQPVDGQQPAPAAVVSTDGSAEAAMKAAGAKVQLTEGQNGDAVQLASDGPDVPAQDLASAAQTAPKLVQETQAFAVKEPARTAEAQANMIDQVTRNVELIFNHNQSGMRIKLYPQELGAIEISLVNKHNGVDVVLVAEQASTQRLLESQSEQLRQALSNSGVQLADLQISQDGFKDQQAGFFEQKNNRKWLKGLPDQAAGKITGTTAVGSLSLHHSVIDYLI